MDLAFLTSWRAALLGASLMTVIAGGARLVFGPDRVERVAEQAASTPMIDGTPSAEIMQRPIAASRPFVSLEISLAELVALLAESFTVTFEPLGETDFIMRAAGVDALTQEPLEYAMHFRAVDGTTVYSPRTLQPVGPSLALQAMAFNREEVSLNETVEFLLILKRAILSRR